MSFAYVTLLTSSNYLPGALVLCSSLRKTGTKHAIVLLLCGDFSPQIIQVAHKHFDRVVVAPTIRSTDTANLDLLGRPELDITYSKLHVFDPQILPFDRVCFLDADVLVLSPIDDIFGFLAPESVEFGASPDIGWPDCFNSGVFITKPSKRLFNSLTDFSRTNASFDGGDQGLLNAFFNDWPTRTPTLAVRIPFIYNVTPTAFYSYMPAFAKYKAQIKTIHFVGKKKPWNWSRYPTGQIIDSCSTSKEYISLVELWWTVFDEFKIITLVNGFDLERKWRINDHQITDGGGYMHTAKYEWNPQESSAFQKTRVPDPEMWTAPHVLTKGTRVEMKRTKSHSPKKLIAEAESRMQERSQSLERIGRRKTPTQAIAYEPAEMIEPEITPDRAELGNHMNANLQNLNIGQEAANTNEDVDGRYSWDANEIKGYNLRKKDSQLLYRNNSQESSAESLNSN